jgi:uncharacterized membrane protein YdfJ with MMPL/SSD domain
MSLPTQPKKRNLAARAGRWSAQHRKAAIIGWIAFVVVAVLIGGAVGTKTLESSEYGVGESSKAEEAHDRAFSRNVSESVLVESRGKRADPRALERAARDVADRLSRIERVENVTTPLDRGSVEGLSRDGRAALVSFELPNDDEPAEDLVGRPLAAVAAAQRAHPQLHIAEFGDASAQRALDHKFEEDFKKAEATSFPITLVILLIAFGALVAAGMPLLLGISAVGAAIGLIGPVSQLLPVDRSIGSIILLIGLAVGVDYSMFYLRREREERAAGRSEDAALEAAAATSGRAVLISGLTVILAMAGMYLAGSQPFPSFATGTILVVAIAVLGSVSVLPALLSVLGDRVDRGRIPFLARIKRGTGESRFWNVVVNRSMRRPLLSAVLCGGVLLALCAPALSLHTELPGIETLPRDLKVIRTYDRIQAHFPGENIAANVVVEAPDVESPAVTGGIERLLAEAKRSDLLLEPATVEVSPDRTVADVEIPLAGDGTDDRSNAALDQLRDRLVPASLGGIEGAEANVGGVTALTRDFTSTMNSHLPYVFGFVFATAFLLLLVTFRSDVIPVKAILLNTLSVGAAYGLLVLLFQNGWGEGLLDFESTGAITSWLPLLMFVILFGLSMDYHVLILTRVRECIDRGMKNDEAVAHAIKGTAGVITSAAIVMVAVFGVFATLSAVELKQMGIGLAAAVLIDATLVRGVLLPASMKLLGDWNWYLPRWLEWLPRIEPEPPPPSEAQTSEVRGETEPIRA